MFSIVKAYLVETTVRLLLVSLGLLGGFVVDAWTKIGAFNLLWARFRVLLDNGNSLFLTISCEILSS